MHIPNSLRLDLIRATQKKSANQKLICFTICLIEFCTLYSGSTENCDEVFKLLQFTFSGVEEVFSIWRVKTFSKNGKETLEKCFFVGLS